MHRKATYYSLKANIFLEVNEMDFKEITFQLQTVAVSLFIHFVLTSN